jgi:hypothetical protein
VKARKLLELLSTVDPEAEVVILSGPHADEAYFDNFTVNFDFDRHGIIPPAGMAGDEANFTIRVRADENGWDEDDYLDDEEDEE